MKNKVIIKKKMIKIQKKMEAIKYSKMKEKMHIKAKIQFKLLALQRLIKEKKKIRNVGRKTKIKIN